MPATRDRQTVTAALQAEFDALVDLGSGLTEEQWATPTCLPTWDVKDNYSHVIGTELMLAGRPDEGEVADADHLRNDIGKFNEVSVLLRRERSGAEVLAELAMVLGERKAAVAAMSDEEWDEVGFTPAGRDSHGRFMQIRVFDCWYHEQDVREALGLPGNEAGIAAEVALDELANSMGFVIGKRAGATDGQSVRLELTGDLARTIDVRVDGRAALVDDLREPTTTLTMPTSLWFRLCGGRVPADPDHDGITIAGDEDLGRRVVEHAAYMI